MLTSTVPFFISKFHFLLMLGQLILDPLFEILHRVPETPPGILLLLLFILLETETCPVRPTTAMWENQTWLFSIAAYLLGPASNCLTQADEQKTNTCPFRLRLAAAACGAICMPHTGSTASSGSPSPALGGR